MGNGFEKKRPFTGFESPANARNDRAGWAAFRCRTGSWCGLHGNRVADACGLGVALKTSGANGIHIVLPLPPRTSYETSAQLALRLAEAVVAANPQSATLERGVKARPKRSIYIDVLQNARGKSMAAPYSVRAKPAATVSAPLRVTEVTGRLRIETFTVKTMPARLVRTGDLWGDAIATRPSARTLARAMMALQDAPAAPPPRRESTKRRRVGGADAGPAPRRRRRQNRAQTD